MLPTAIVKEAKKRNLDLIGICDHNSVENVEAVKKAGEKEAMAVIGGVEISSREEVHILGLFGNAEALQDIKRMIEQNLRGENDEKAFGEQLIVDETDRITGSNGRLLIGATELSIEEVVDAIHDLEGLAIASHIDRESFGILGQLGLIPSGLRLDALELSDSAVGRREKFYQEYDFPFVTSSDAHYLNDIGRSCTSFFMKEVSIEEIRKALGGKDGRRAMIE
jgi:PHP family Zn ribbon phosphoesterase